MKAKIEARVAKCIRQRRSPYPRCAVRGKGINKQGFPNTRGGKG